MSGYPYNPYEGYPVMSGASPVPPTPVAHHTQVSYAYPMPQQSYQAATPSVYGLPSLPPQPQSPYAALPGVLPPAFTPSPEPIFYAPRASTPPVPQPIPSTMYPRIPSTPPSHGLLPPSPHNGGYSPVPGKVYTPPPNVVGQFVHAPVTTSPLFVSKQAPVPQLAIASYVNANMLASQYATSQIPPENPALRPAIGNPISVSKPSGIHASLFCTKTYTGLPKTMQTTAHVIKPTGTATSSTYSTATSAKLTQPCSNELHSSFVTNNPAVQIRPTSVRPCFFPQLAHGAVSRTVTPPKLLLGVKTYTDMSKTISTSVHGTVTMVTPTATTTTAFSTGASSKLTWSCSNQPQPSLVTNNSAVLRYSSSGTLLDRNTPTDQDQIESKEMLEHSEEEVTEALYRKFVGVLQQHGSMEPTHEKILNEFIKLTTYERKLIMVKGSIKNFLAASHYFHVHGNLLALSGLPLSSRISDTNLSYPKNSEGCFNDLDDIPDTGQMSQGEDGVWDGEDESLFEQMAYTHGITITKPGTSGDESYSESPETFQNSDMTEVQDTLLSSDVLEGGMYDGQWAAGDSEVLSHLHGTTGVGDEEYKGISTLPKGLTLEKGDIPELTLGAEEEEGDTLSYSKHFIDVSVHVKDQSRYEKASLSKTLPCVGSAKNMLNNCITKDGKDGDKISFDEVDQSYCEGWAKGFLRSSGDDPSSPSSTDDNTDNVECSHNFEDLDKAIGTYVESWTDEAEPLVKVARNVVLSALLGAKTEILKDGSSFLNPLIPEFKPKIPQAADRGLQSVLSVNSAEFRPSGHKKSASSFMNAGAEEFKPRTATQSFPGAGIERPSLPTISKKYPEKETMQKSEMNVSASVFTPKFATTVAMATLNGNYSSSQNVESNKKSNVVLTSSNHKSFPSLEDLPSGAQTSSSFSSATYVLGTVGSTDSKRNMTSTSPLNPGHLLDKTLLISPMSKTLKEFRPRVPNVPGVPELRLRGITSIPSLNFPVQRPTMQAKLTTGVQTDQLALCDNSTNTRHQRKLDFSAQTCVYNTREVGMNTTETLFRKDSVFFDKSLKYVTRETMTNSLSRSNKKVQVGLPFLFHKATRHRATMTEPTEQVGTIDSLLYDEAVSRAVQAEEKILKLESHICLAELMRMLSELDYKYQYHLSDDERKKAESDYKHSIQMIKDEMNRLEILYQSNLSALRDGLKLSQLPPISVSCPQIVAQPRIQPSKLFQPLVTVPASTASTETSKDQKITMNPKPGVPDRSNTHSPTPVSDYASVTSEPADILGFSEYTMSGSNHVTKCSDNEPPMQPVLTEAEKATVDHTESLPNASTTSGSLQAYTDPDSNVPVLELAGEEEPLGRSTSVLDNQNNSLENSQWKSVPLEDVPARVEDIPVQSPYNHQVNEEGQTNVKSSLIPSAVPSSSEPEVHMMDRRCTENVDSASCKPVNVDSTSIKTHCPEVSTLLKTVVPVGNSSTTKVSEHNIRNKMEDQAQQHVSGLDQSGQPGSALKSLHADQLNVPDLSSLPQAMVLQAQMNPMLPQIMMVLSQMSPNLAMDPQLLNVVAVNHLISMQLARDSGQLPLGSSSTDDVSLVSGKSNQAPPALANVTNPSDDISVSGLGLTKEEEMTAQKVLKALSTQQSCKRSQGEESSDSQEAFGSGPKTKKRISQIDEAKNSSKTVEKSSMKPKYGPLKLKRRGAKKSPTGSLSVNGSAVAEQETTPAIDSENWASKVSSSKTNNSHLTRGSRKSSFSSDISSLSGSSELNSKNREFEEVTKQADFKSVIHKGADAKSDCDIGKETRGLSSKDKNKNSIPSLDAEKDLIQSWGTPSEVNKSASSNLLKSWGNSSDAGRSSSPSSVTSAKSLPNQTKKRTGKVFTKDSDVTLNYGQNVSTGVRSKTPESWEDTVDPFPSSWKVGTEFARNEISLPKSGQFAEPSRPALPSKKKFATEGSEGFTFSMDTNCNPVIEEKNQRSSRESSSERILDWDPETTLQKPSNKFENLWKAYDVSNHGKAPERSRIPQYGSMLSASGFKAPAPPSSVKSSGAITSAFKAPTSVTDAFPMHSSSSKTLKNFNSFSSESVARSTIDSQDWPCLGANMASGARPKTSVWGSASSTIGKSNPLMSSLKAKPPTGAKGSIPVSSNGPTVLGKVSAKNKYADATYPSVTEEKLGKPETQAKYASGLSVRDKTGVSAISDIKVHDDFPGMDVGEDVDEWQQVGKKKKGSKGEVALSYGTVGASTAASKNKFDKLVNQLMESFPYLSRHNILELIQEIRINRGSLKGIAVSQIMADAQTVVKDWKLNNKIQTPTSAGLNPEQLNSLLYKTTICSFWQQGACPNGSKCLYAHGKQELRRSPKYILCNNWKKGSCTYGPKCAFAHGEHELEPPPSEFLRTRHISCPVTVSKPLGPAWKVNAPEPTGVVMPLMAWRPGRLSSLSESDAGDPVPGTIYKHIVLTDDEDGDLETCAICFDPIKDHEGKKLECGHEFHQRCIMRWITGEERTCPTCRRHALTNEDFPALGQ